MGPCRSGYPALSAPSHSHFTEAYKIQSRLSWSFRYAWGCCPVWYRGALCLIWSIPWMLTQFAWNRRCFCASLKDLPFAWVCRACPHCNTHIRNRSYWLFLACRCTSRCTGRPAAWRGCWSRWRCILRAWGSLWIFRPAPPWWQLTVLWWDG